MLAACTTRPDRDQEIAPNQQVGIEVTQTREGVQVRLPDRVLFDFDKSFLRPDSGPAINRAVVLLVGLGMVVFGWQNFLSGFGSFRMPSMLPIAYLYAPIPLCGALVAMFSLGLVFMSKSVFQSQF